MGLTTACWHAGLDSIAASRSVRKWALDAILALCSDFLNYKKRHICFRFHLRSNVSSGSFNWIYLEGGAREGGGGALYARHCQMEKKAWEMRWWSGNLHFQEKSGLVSPLTCDTWSSEKRQQFPRESSHLNYSSFCWFYIIQYAFVLLLLFFWRTHAQYAAAPDGAD